MSVYSDIVKRSYFDGSTGKALQNFADQSGSSALDMDCVRPNTIESCPLSRSKNCSYSSKDSITFICKFPRKRENT